MAAVSGANGSILWERPVAQDGAFVECGILQPRGSAAPSACVVLGRPGPLVAVDTLTGGLLLAAGPLGSRSQGCMLLRGQLTLPGVVSLDRREGMGLGAVRSHTPLCSPPVQLQAPGAGGASCCPLAGQVQVPGQVQGE